MNYNLKPELTKEEWAFLLTPRNKKISNSVKAHWNSLSQEARQEVKNKAAYGKKFPIYLRSTFPIIDYSTDPDYVKCEICGSYFHLIHILHLRSHNISLQEYSSLYPNSPTCSKGLRQRQSNSHLALPRSKETGELIAENNRRNWADPTKYIERCTAIRESMSSPKFRKRRAEISRANWKNPEYIRKVMEGKAIEIRFIQSPNNEEVIFWIWVNSFRPNSIVHNREYLPVARLTPDFLVLGEKKVIEYFGVYWHDPYSGAPGFDSLREEEYHRRYKEANYKCLIVWSDEVFLDETQKRIEAFLDDKV